MAQYRDLFIVSSALVTAYGLLPTEQRVRQTMATLASIRAQAPDADIVVLELSRERISHELEQQFWQHHPRHILHFSEHGVIQHHYQVCSNEQDPAGSRIKNLNEIAAMHVFLKWAIEHDYLQPYRRVFKISGRYQLCAPFHPSIYEQEVFQGRCAFLKQSPSYLDVRVSGAANYAYMTRLWSFDPVLLPRLEVWFESMLDMLWKRYEVGGYTDIEHLLSMAIPRAYCVYLDKVGVQGMIGLNGLITTE